jgi:uncharacterized membrane protein
MIASDTVVTADSQDLEIILGCSIGILFGLAIIITITVIAGILIKVKFKGNIITYCCSIIAVSMSISVSTTGLKTANQCDQENIPSTQAPYYDDVVLKQYEQELELKENVAYALIP